MKTIWRWLAQDKNNKAISSITSILVAIGALTIVSGIVNYTTDIFSSVNVIAYESMSFVVVENEYNRDVLILDLITHTSIDGERNVTLKPLYEIVPANSITNIAILGNDYLPLSYSAVPPGPYEEEILVETTKEECFFRVVSKSPTHEYVRNDEKAPDMQTFDVNTTLRYSVSEKVLEREFSSLGFVLFADECEEKLRNTSAAPD